MLTLLQLPRSWFRVTKQTCVRREQTWSASPQQEEEEEEESYFSLPGRIFIAPHALWFHSNFAEQYCVPIPAAPEFPLPSQDYPCTLPQQQVFLESQLDELSHVAGIAFNTGELLLRSSSSRNDAIEPLSIRKGSFYMTQNQPMLCIAMPAAAAADGALKHFALTEEEYRELARLNERAVLKDSFFFQSSMSLLERQGQTHTTALGDLMTGAQYEAVKRSALFPAPNEVWHCGLLRKRNRNFGLSAKYVLLMLGRIVTVSAESSSQGMVKSADLARARCRVLGERSFECQLAAIAPAAAMTSLHFTCEDKQERDAWIHHIQICALFPGSSSKSSQQQQHASPLQQAQCKSLEDILAFAPQTFGVEDLLQTLGRARGELDANMRQSTLDFERDRVVINGTEVAAPCLMPDIILAMAREINALGEGPLSPPASDAAAITLTFIRLILLATTRTQCGGMIYEALQQCFRGTSELQDRFLICPRSEQVAPIEITLERAQAQVSPAPPRPPALERADSFADSPYVSAPALLSPRAELPAASLSEVLKPLPDAALPAKRTHRRSSSDPQFFLKMLQKPPQPPPAAPAPPPAPPSAASAVSTMSGTFSLGSMSAPSLVTESPPKPPLRSLLPPPPASAAAYFKHHRAFSYQKKTLLHSVSSAPSSVLTGDQDFLHMDALPASNGNSANVCAHVSAEMDFCIVDCETNERVACVRAIYARDFFMIEGRSLAKDQGHISLRVLDAHELDIVPATSASPSQEQATELEDVSSVVYVSDDEDKAASSSQEEEEEEDDDDVL